MLQRHVLRKLPVLQNMNWNSGVKLIKLATSPIPSRPLFRPFWQRPLFRPLNSPPIPSYDFDSPFTVVSQGAGYGSGGPTALEHLDGDILRHT